MMTDDACEVFSSSSKKRRSPIRKRSPIFFFWSDVGFRVFSKKGKKDRERIFWREREGEKRKGVFESYFILLVVTICGRKRICRRERETDGEKERDVLLGARPDWVCRGGRRLGVAPARDARGGKPRGVWIARRRHSFGRGGKRRFQTVGTYYVGRDIIFFLSSSSSFEDDDVCSLSSRLVEHHHITTTTTSACVSPREEASSDATARLGEDRQTERARRCFLAVRAHLFFFC